MGVYPPSNIGAISPTRGSPTGGPGESSPGLPPQGPKQKFC